MLINEYKPLPDFLTIKKSDIHGLGLFSKKFIPEGTELGISHLHNENFPDNPILNSEPCIIAVILTLLINFITGINQTDARPETKT